MKHRLCIENLNSGDTIEFSFLSRKNIKSIIFTSYNGVAVLGVCIKSNVEDYCYPNEILRIIKKMS